MEGPRVAPAGDDGRRLPTLNPGDTFASRYKVEKLLGKGLYGETYQVKHLRYGQYLVLKVFYPGAVASEEARQLFKNEFDKVKQLKHPGIVRYYEQGDWPEGNTKYCTMEFINGSSLRTLMAELTKQGKKFSPQDAVQIAVKLLETLKDVHTAGVSHRNIKPEHVLIVAKGKAADKVQWDLRLSDFAFAHMPVEWMADVPPEKIPYMAPELRGYGGQVGPRSDIFGVGALFYELLTGVSPEDTLRPPSSIRSSLPRKIDDIIELCLAAMPSDRYSSIQDLLFELEPLRSTLPVGEEDSEPRSKLTPLYVATGLAILLGVIGFLITREPAKPAEAEGPARWAKLRETVRSSGQDVTETAEEIAAKTSKAPEGMVYIPAGSYIRGALKGEPNTKGTEPVEVQVQMPGFYIDVYEFPNKKGEKPKTSITWDDAEKACNRLGKRLCTVDEWERACKGRDFSIYSYGDVYDAAKCPSIATTGAQPAGKNLECVSSWGVFDMSGNVPEWTNAQPAGREERRITRGGIVGSNEAQGTRCASLNDENKGIADAGLGFRCCK